MKVHPIAKRIAALLSLMIFGASLAAASTWYVAPVPQGTDSNNCAQPSKGDSGNGPCATITHVSKVVSPGDTVLVEPGVYDENVLGALTTSASGTASLYITYKSQVQWGAVVVQANNDSSSPPAWTNSGNFVVIEGFDVVGVPNGRHHASTEGIHISGNHNIIRHNKVHGFAPQWCDGNGGSGINVVGSNNEVVANLIYGNGPTNFPYSAEGQIDGNTVWVRNCPFVHGIYFKNQYELAAENIIYKNSGYGIQEYGQSSNITTVNNTIVSNGCGGIYVGNENSIDPDSNNNSFTDNNIVYAAEGCQTCTRWSTATDPATGTTVPVCTALGSFVSGYGIHDPQSSARASCNVYDNNLAFGNRSGNIIIPAGLQNKGNIQAEPLLTSIKLDGTNIFVGWPSQMMQSGGTSPALNAGISTDTNSGPGCIGNPPFGAFPNYDFAGNPRPGKGPGAAYDIGAWESTSINSRVGKANPHQETSARPDAGGIEEKSVHESPSHRR